MPYYKCFATHNTQHTHTHTQPCRFVVQLSVNFVCFVFVAESLVQELELERKSRQHQTAERDQVKSPLQGALNKSTRSFSCARTP